MYQVKINSKEIIRFDTKEDLILYFARREPITLGVVGEQAAELYSQTVRPGRYEPQRPVHPRRYWTGPAW